MTSSSFVRLVSVRQPTRLFASRPVLAFGVDTVPGVAWQEGESCFSLRPREPIPAFDFFPAAIRYLRRHRRTFDVIAYDPHPSFEAGRAAAQAQGRFWPGARLVPVWHHVAHAANFAHAKGRRPFIGVAFDGTGFGADGAVWGGEFFVFRGRRCRRAAHFRYLPLLGGEQAILHPWRMGFSVVLDALGSRPGKRPPRFLKGRSQGTLRLLAAMARQNVGTQRTSSVGRLFDAASAILRIAPETSSEGEAARALERCAAEGHEDVSFYPFEVLRGQEGWEISIADAVRAMLRDQDAGRPAPEIARTFHKTIAEIVCDVARRLRRSSGLRDVYLSGGVFMNDILRREAARCLSDGGFRVTLAPKPETTDLGIATGQVAAVILGVKSLRV